MRDREFIRGKVPMTKELVRAVTIDALNLSQAKYLLDIGAGTGSISIQAAYEYPQLQVTAVERNPEAVELIQSNQKKFNLSNIEILEGVAPDISLPEVTYDAVFIGGSGRNLTQIIDQAIDVLSPGGRLVLNFILMENALEAYEHLTQLGMEVEMRLLQVSCWHSLGSGHYFKPNNPTIIIRTEVKGE
ncbi:cobalt-precorrin-6Y C(15)-methyltransferase [Suicoccus acidiformans]|uniref:Cobalt-precorrin-6Y C(15)-methyltransferase n=1 Tax=Suicoccus acidiformans TaxID=2036206 RepID=A0A347WM17_9LACT|nr:decarboxylating cobalt-precorrin-6B (C(15))-methyltransferase [Suicoccus acidiformans]AXY26124.1 cobalt-precorrin-6Y C(15)-methyltransferase [Suicoccus acidiformans]